MLFLSRQQTGKHDADQRIVIVTYQTRVSILWLHANCTMDSAIKEMQTMFAIADNTILENRGCICQTKEIIAAATEISQIKLDRDPNARKIREKVIRLEIS